MKFQVPHDLKQNVQAKPTCDGEVIIDVSRGLQFLDERLWDRKGRLTKGQVANVLPIGLHLFDLDRS